ncbi:MAG: type II secretion system protein [Gammaproteobacteria bacterium]|nr:type II secretion system protein [Gammaproteobacteria bacterium]
MTINRSLARGRRARGFSLVELVVTLVIIGTLAATAAPLFFQTSDFEDQGFFEEVLSTMRYAQKLAMASGCTVRVVISSNTISLNRAADAATCTTAPFATAVADPTNPASSFVRTRTGVSITPQDASVADFTFAPLGNASVTAPLRQVTVGGHAMRIWATTGFVERL